MGMNYKISNIIAQKSSNPQTSTAMTGTTRALLVLFAVLQLVDMATTLYGVEHGLRERNDMLVGAARYIGMTLAVTSAKVLCVLAAVYFCWTFREAWAKVTLAGAIVFYFYIAAGNLLAIIKG